MATAAPARCSLVQRVRYDYTAPVHNLRQRLILIPPAVHGSARRHGWSLDVDGAAATATRARRDSFGNLALVLHDEGDAHGRLTCSKHARALPA